MTPLNKPDDHQDLRRLLGELNDDSFDEWRVDDQPHVDCADFDSLDDALAELGRRLDKSGRLDEAEQRRHYVKPSDRKRRERQAQAHRAKTGAERRWRGGVEP